MTGYIIERKKVEKQLEEHQDHLEAVVTKRTEELEHTHSKLLHAEKLSALGKLTGTIAHEFNNPICGVRNILEEIEEDGDLDEELNHLLVLALKECDRMASFIDKLKGFYRPSSEVPSLFDVNSVIDDIFILTKKLVKERKSTIEIEVFNGLPKFNGHEDQIKQVLLNLVQNALDALPEEGGKIIIRTAFENSSIKVEVHDSGCGIPEDRMDSIFEPFITTKKVKGLGLGLSISYEIIKKHGGDIKVQSTPGEGTVFIILLPCKGDHNGKTDNFICGR